jgi:hypothetical protein
MKHLRTLSILLLVLLSSGAFSQRMKQLLADGDKAFADKDYFSAAQYYNRAILQDSSDIALQYKYAEASRLNYDYDIADHWYSKVLKRDPQGKIYPECTFWLATIRKYKGKYKDARKMFDKYAKKNKKKKDSYFVKKAIQEVAACDFAQLLMANPDRSVNVVHLDSNVNSKVSEYAPFQVDSLLYFSSLRDRRDRDKKNNISFNKIYVADRDTTRKENDPLRWQKARELDSLFNRNGIHNANTAFNNDFSKVFITRCGQEDGLNFVCEIFSSDFKNGSWTPLTRLPSPVNIPGKTSTQPAVGRLNGQDVLFFSSDRPGGEGGMDIWYSTMNGNDFGVPVNAGKRVNTVEDEITPYFCLPCGELFFSSTWHKGLGEFDIFKSSFSDGSFGEPKNLGFPVNSNYNDIYFTINSSRTEAYISSNRKGSYFEEKESCCNDIWMFPIPQISEPPKKVDSTQVFVTQMKLLVPLTLYFHNDEPDKKTLSVTTKKNYRTAWQEYTAMHEQYKREYSKGAKGEMLERANGEIDALFEDSVDAGMQDLEKFAELLVKVLKDKEKVTITMKGYCSPLASTDYNINLAKRRIVSLRNYFLEYQNGVLLKYVDNTNPDMGSITFIDEQIGELKARTHVSDDYYDTRNSVYSPAAALERKIQIIAISTFSAGSK